MDLALHPRRARLPRRGAGVLPRQAAGRASATSWSTASTWLAKDDIVTGSASSTPRAGRCANWPVEWGGTGWTPVQRQFSRRDAADAGAAAAFRFGVTMVGPVIIAFGARRRSSASCRASPIVDDWWCQGFSEPGAGSDLASLRTTAEARRRPLRRQRPEDLDHLGAARRLDLLPGAHRSAAPRSRRAFPSC